MPLLARRPRRSDRAVIDEIRTRYVAFLPYVLPKVTVIQPSLVPDGYLAGVVAAHSEVLHDALNISSDRGRIKAAWLALPAAVREDLAAELFASCAERAQRQGYPLGDWRSAARSAAVRHAPVGGTEPLRFVEAVDAAT